MDKKIKASYTVEASIVISIVIFIVISMMYLTFYVHDRIVLDLCAYNAAIESVFENKSLHETAAQQVESLNTLVIMPDCTWTSSNDGINVTYIGSFSIPFSALSPLVESEDVTEIKKTYPKMKVERIYVLKTVGDTFKK